MNITFIGSGAVDDFCHIPPVDCDAQKDVQHVGGIPTLPPVVEDQMPQDHSDMMLDDGVIMEAVRCQAAKWEGICISAGALFLGRSTPRL